MSKQSHQVYDIVEKKHAFGHSSPSKLTFGITIFLVSISAMLPISHAIIGYPPPNQWLLPVDTQ